MTHPPRNSATHTPTPWRFKEYGDVLEVQGIHDGVWATIAAFRFADLGLWQRANAALIVRAVNAHDKLLSALKGLLETDHTDTLLMADAIDAAKAAIAKAEGR